MEQAVADQTRAPPAVPRRGLVFVASLMATFMAAVESTIVATAMPTIVADLGGFSLFSWVFAAYLLAMAVTIPVYGRLADLYGRKRVFFAGAGIFLVGSTLCGFARSMLALVLFRALQGIGAGAVQPLASTIVGDIYTPTERARAQGWISSVFGVSAIVGPALGAFLVTHLHWSVVFWVNVPIGCVAIVMFAVFLRERIEKRPHRIDYLGAVLMVLGVGALMLALVQATRLDLPHILGLAALGVAALAALFAHERRAPEPMLPLSLWRRRIIALANLGVCGTGATMMGVTVLLPTYVQGAMGGSPGLAGMVLGAMSVSWMFASIGAGRLMIRTSYRLTASLGGVALVGGSAVLLSLDPWAGILWPLSGSLLIGIGMGSCNTSFLVSLQASVDWRERAVATGSNMFMRMIGQALGASVFGAIFNFGLERRLPGAGGAVNRLLEPGAHGLAGVDVAPIAAAIAHSAYDAYLVVVAVAALTLLVGLRYPAGLSPSRPRPDA